VQCTSFPYSLCGYEKLLVFGGPAHFMIIERDVICVE